MSKLIKKLAFVFMVTLLTAVTTNIAYAADDTDDVDKTLALYNADGDIDGDGTEDLWVGLKFVNETKKTCMEVSYNGKSLTSLVDEGYTVEIRNYYEYPSQIVTGFWYNIDKENILPGDEKDLFVFSYTENTENTYRFRILGKDGSLISTSDKFVIDPDITFPFLISSNPISYDLYDFDGKSIKVSLKYNDNLTLKDPNKKEYIDISKFDRISTDSPFFVTNLEYNNYSDKISINGKDYDYNYCIVTYNCTFSNYDLTNINSDKTYADYYYKLENLVGKNYNEEPYKFYFRIFSYKDTSLNPQKKVNITESKKEIQLNESTNLETEVLSNEVSKENFTWISSDESIATVDKNGSVTATGVGRAYIYVTEDNTDELYDYCIVDVLGPVNNISLDVTTLSLKTGESYKLIPTVEPETALDKTIIWTSSDEKIATVDEDGLVTAKGAGTVVITATSNYDPTISCTCHIIVTNPVYKVSSIKITVPSSIKVGSNFKITATISPSNATNKKVTWKSSNTNYATVNSSGTVSIKSAGAGKTVKITATAKDGSGVTKTVTLKIPTIKVSKLKIKASKSTVVAGKSVKLTASITPSNATNKKVTWKSSNTKYATVNSSGVVVTKKAGKGKVVKITATAKDNSKIKATITIKIK